MGIRVGICGVGAFANSFIPLFKAHPDVDNVILCDLDADKLAAKSEQFGIADRSPSLEHLCGTDVDAVAIITQHHLHGPQAVQVGGYRSAGTADCVRQSESRKANIP